MSTDENQALIRRWLEEGWNQGNLTVADALFASDYVLHEPASPEPVRGPAGAKRLAAMYRGAFPDVRFTIEEMLAAGDTVVTRYTARGTHRGELFGIAPTGKQVAVTGIIISRCAGGKIAEERANWDTLALLQQLGAVPALGQLGRRAA